MGRSTEAEQVPFQATVWDGDIYWAARDGAPELLIAQCLNEGVAMGSEDGSTDEADEDTEEPWNEDGPKPLTTETGWTGTWGASYGCLYTVKWTKDDKVVHFVNENEWENGGGMTATYFSDVEEHLRAFLDENFPPPHSHGILKNRTVTQTL